jgi:N-acetylneuraminic acid mutarotase
MRCAYASAVITRRFLAATLAAAPLLSSCARAAPPPRAPWRSAPDAPYAVQEIYPALHNNAIWIAGGFSPQALGATERVIVFDLANNRWSDGPALPTPSHHVQLASLNGELWAIGGFIAGPLRLAWTCTSRVLKLRGDAWVEGPSLPKPIGEGVPLVHQGRIHLIGGRSPRGAANSDWSDQIDVDDHFVLASNATSWERAAPLPMARNSAAGVSKDDAIHIISGRTVAADVTGAHHIYESGAWREGPAFPEPRGGLAAAVYHGAVTAGGGEVFEPGSVGDALYALDDASETWTRTETLPTPRHGYGLVAAGTALYAVGGAQRPSASGTLSSMHVLG